MTDFPPYPPTKYAGPISPTRTEASFNKEEPRPDANPAVQQKRGDIRFYTDGKLSPIHTMGIDLEARSGESPKTPLHIVDAAPEDEWEGFSPPKSITEVMLRYPNRPWEVLNMDHLAGHDYRIVRVAPSVDGIVIWIKDNAHPEDAPAPEGPYRAEPSDRQGDKRWLVANQGEKVGCIYGTKGECEDIRDVLNRHELNRIKGDKADD